MSQTRQIFKSRRDPVNSEAALRRLKKTCRRAGLLLNCARASRSITVRPLNPRFIAEGNPGALESSRRLLCGLLNNFEKFYSISLKGFPPCFLPGAEDHHAREKVPGRFHSFLPGCGQCKFKGDCPGIAAKPGARVPRRAEELLRPIPDLPNEVVLEVNKICNLKCKVCFADLSGVSVPGKKLAGLIDEIHALGIRNVRFTGGEPLFHKDIFPLMKYARGLGLYVTLNTNASFTEPGVVRELEKYADNILVSLQGLDSFTEERLTGGGRIFEERLRNIRALRESGIGVLRIGTVISRCLLNGLNKYRELMETIQPDSWELYRPMLPKGRLARLPEFDISAADAAYLAQAACAMKMDGLNVNLANPVPFCIIKNGKARRLAMLGGRFDDGHSRLVFDAGGFYKPSYFINRKLGPRLIKAWRNPFLLRMRSLSYLPPECGECESLRLCLGGSRFQARQQYGSYFAPDPWMAEIK